MKAPALLSAEMRLWRAARDAAFGRALPLAERGLSVHGAHRQHVIALVVLLLIEAPSVHFILGGLFPLGLGRSAAQMLLATSSAYAIVWLVGDLRLFEETRGLVVESGRLFFDCGQRARGEVLVDHITRIEQGRFETSGDSIRVSPTAIANCRIWLSRPIALEGPFGLTLRSDRVDVQLDDPGALALAVGKSSPQSVRVAHGLRDRPSPAVE